MNGDRNALARAGFKMGLGTRKLGGLVGPDGKELNAGNPYRVAVVVVSQGAMVYADHSLALASLAFNPGALLALVGQKVEPGHGNVSQGYNNAIEAARPLQVDYFFFVAPDLAVPQHALRALISHQLDVVGAAYMDASDSGGIVMMAIDDQPMPEEQQLIKVRAIPPGCLLVRAKALDKMRRPYFRAGLIEEDTAAGTMPAIVPEWVGFCDQVLAAGMDVWCDRALSTQVRRAGESHFQIPSGPTEAEQVAAAQEEAPRVATAH